MKIKEALKQASCKISKRWAETPLLDAQVLFQKAAGMTKEALLASYNCDVGEKILGDFDRMVDKRCAGFPVAYITGEKEFFGLSFFVNENVLIPRRDTETLVELVLEEAQKLWGAETLAVGDSALLPVRILDLCTGSGCVAIALQHELGGRAVVEASDISAEAETVFYKNCENILGKKLPFHKSNLFNSIKSKYNIIVSNPPYLRNIHVDEMISNQWPEPEIALRGGDDGLDFIREIVEISVKHLEDEGLICMEAEPSQMDIIQEILIKNNFSDVSIKRDMAQRKRVISAWKK
ncbi:MAG: peptide chain release factor N(5)-glutamine methyltransferase [Spirochaetes bacterium]|nr:peptide chain release factor N(5)-glutamine methyltransferase [Spirochaetota bacterium]